MEHSPEMTYGASSLGAASSEALQQQYQAALGRIEAREDGDYLDGYPLPPDNDDVWKTQRIDADVTRFIEPSVGFESVCWTTERRISILEITNAVQRQRNIQSIINGCGPFDITPEQTVFIGLELMRQAKPSRMQKLAAFVGRIVEGIAEA